MGRKGGGHTRTYQKNDIQTSPKHHTRRQSSAVKSSEQSTLNQKDCSPKKHSRHPTTQTRTDVSPIMSHRTVEMPVGSGHLSVLAQLLPRFMVGSACVSSKRRGYLRSKKARDLRNSSQQQQHKRSEESPCKELATDHNSHQKDDIVVPPSIVEPETTVATDETETEGDDESSLLVSYGAAECESDDEDDCLLCCPEPVRFGQMPVKAVYEEEDEEEDEKGECKGVILQKDLSESLPTPVLETILKHSDVCTRYALGYTCVRWNRITINSGLEWCSHHHESIENLLLNEAEHPPVENYALLHPYITPMLRLAYADWLCNIARDTDQPPSVLPLAFRLFDRTLSSVEQFPVQQLQALAAACFWIASKIRGNESLMATDMCVFSGGLFASQVICSLERFVMKTVNYRLLPPTTRDFLEMYLDNCTRLLSTGYVFTVDPNDEAENVLCPSSTEFDEWAENVRESNEGLTVADCMSFLETLSLHIYSLAPCQPSVLSVAIFSISLAIVAGSAPLRSAFVRYATHAFLIEDLAVPQCCSLLMNMCVMVQEVHECKFLRTAYPAFFPKCVCDCNTQS